MGSKKVVILLSTYNGAKYLRELLDSLLNQTHKNISILVRDDGSTDATLEILAEYSNRHNTFTYYKGENLKPARSFMDLLQQSEDADYYALSDQDDVWLPDKIEIAINQLEANKADLYHSAFQMTNSCLVPIPTPKKQMVNTLGQSMVLINATGCTMVLSKKARDFANLYDPSYMIMHDYWLIQLTYAWGGKVIYDETPHILYRQHGGNVLGGVPESFIPKWKGRIKRAFHPKKERWRQLSELYKGYASVIPPQEMQIVKPLVQYQDMSFFNRVRLALNKNYKSNNSSKNFLFRISVIFKFF